MSVRKSSELPLVHRPELEWIYGGGMCERNEVVLAAVGTLTREL